MGKPWVPSGPLRGRRRSRAHGQRLSDDHDIDDCDVAVVGYSDALRLEIGHEVEVTTVYPGYIKTAIHDESVDQGFSLEGLVPEEPLEEACTAIVRAALGRYRRDVATTRSGSLAYAGVRRLPRRLVDVGTMVSLRRQLRRDDFTRSPLAVEFARAMRKSG